MERDDIVEYSLDAHHSEEEGVKKRKTIWKVTGILTAITVVEVFAGSYFKQHDAIWPLIKWSFIILTLFKAGFIVLSFMHLGDERKSLKYVILAPYFVFILYLIFICLTESTALAEAWTKFGV
jgi:cytochrome c oxidase subunit IV